MRRRKPVIGISSSQLIDKGGMFPGYKRIYVNNDYIKTILKSGAVPIIIPIIDDLEVIDEIIRNIDGLILSGGHDINPLIWGEDPKNKIGEILPRRDECDLRLFEKALEMNKPVLGICRGFQLINVALGGKLYQDLSYMEGCYIKHNQGHTPELPTHKIKIKKDTKLFNILGEETQVNSFHHLVVKEIGKDLKIAATSEDGVIEAIEHKGGKLVYGVQWHPEMMSGDNKQMQRIFDVFIDETADY